MKYGILFIIFLSNYVIYAQVDLRKYAYLESEYHNKNVLKVNQKKYSDYYTKTYYDSLDQIIFIEHHSKGNQYVLFFYNGKAKAKIIYKKQLKLVEFYDTAFFKYDANTYLCKDVEGEKMYFKFNYFGFLEDYKILKLHNNAFVFDNNKTKKRNLSSKYKNEWAKMEEKHINDSISEYQSHKNDINLIQNGGFEASSSKKTIISIDNQIEYWNSYIGSPDWYCDSSLAKNGMACMGFRTYSMDLHIEYLENTLLHTLEKDSNYCLTFYIKNATNRRYATDALGVLISNNFYTTKANWSKNIEPNYINPNGHILASNTWHPIQIGFKANGHEDKLYIGPYKKIEELKRDYMVFGKNIIEESYFLIDDVSMYKTKNLCQSNLVPFHQIEPRLSKLNTKYIFKNLNFENDSFRIKANFIRDLDSVLSILNTFSNYNLEIIGHTDSSYGFDYNMKLSYKRAQSISEYFINKGIDKKRIIVSGKGYTEPLSDHKTDINRFKNRRVEFMFFLKQ